MIITLDGLDGVGKSTVAEMLKVELNATVIKGVRDIYVDKLAYGSPNIDVRCLYYLASFLDSILEAKTKINTTIIFDKSFYTTIAYHKCLGSQIDLEKTITSLVNPDLKVYLTCPKDIWVKRLLTRKNISWYEEKIINQDSLAENIELTYSKMGLCRIVNDNLENTVLDILKLIQISNAHEL